MKIALLLYGISLDYNYNDSYINASEYNFNNYNFFIIEPLKEKNEIDTYLCTNDMSIHAKKYLLDTYKPKDYFFENGNNVILSVVDRNIKVKKVIELCLNSKIEYDAIILTRFDLKFKKKITETNINYNKFNILGFLKLNERRAINQNALNDVPTLAIEDNFVLFPFKYLESFLNIITKNINVLAHLHTNDIFNMVDNNNIIWSNKTLIPDNINIISNEPNNNISWDFYSLHKIKSDIFASQSFKIKILEYYIQNLKIKTENGQSLLEIENKTTQKGPPGLPGIEGKTGPQGPQGPQGRQGIQGPKGIQGDRGPQGIPGSCMWKCGPQGEKGLRGEKGDRGIQGPKGIQGDRGPQGPQGPQGQGVRGPQGIPGPQGEKGPRGEKGPQGIPGPQGTEGKTGPEGPQGIAGPPGMYPQELNTIKSKIENIENNIKNLTNLVNRCLMMDDSGNLLLNHVDFGTDIV
tara:strand:+ start:1802 stop:3190 length:1389 start_codon:yes stop_codon:yes gene_type:complete